MLKHNRFAQDVEKNLLSRAAGARPTQQQLQKIQQELDAERQKGTVTGADNGLVREQSRLSDALNAMAEQYDTLNSQFAQFQRVTRIDTKESCSSSALRAKEQQERDAIEIAATPNPAPTSLITIYLLRVSSLSQSGLRPSS